MNNIENSFNQYPHLTNYIPQLKTTHIRNLMGMVESKDSKKMRTSNFYEDSTDSSECASKLISQLDSIYFFYLSVFETNNDSILSLQFIEQNKIELYFGNQLSFSNSYSEQLLIDLIELNINAENNSILAKTDEKISDSEYQNILLFSKILLAINLKYALISQNNTTNYITSLKQAYMELLQFRVDRSIDYLQEELDHVTEILAEAKEYGLIECSKPKEEIRCD